MSWARYGAPRARAPLKRRADTPLAARSWLTRLNSIPAAPPTLDTGGAGALGAGRSAVERPATGAGAAAGPEAAAGAGAGGASSTSRVRSFSPACRGRQKGTPGALEGVGRPA